MGSGPARTGELAILVPYRNRQAYLDIFLREVPKYLERANGISDYVIYVAEQQSQDLFNLALSRNVAARAALDDGMFGYFVFPMWTSSRYAASTTGRAASTWPGSYRPARAR